MNTTTTGSNNARERVAIEAKGVSRTFGNYQALDAVDLSVRKGEQIAIMGPSGCGKTTLLNILGGLDRPDNGSVTIDGKSIVYRDSNLTELHRTAIGFVFQGYGLIPSLTALENVEFTMLANRTDPETREKRSRALLDAVALLDYADRYPEELSGGQRQRVAVARSLAHSPGVVLADEPTGNLDRETGMQVIAVLSRACRDRGAVLVVVTHDPEVAAEMQRVVHMQDGGIVAAGRIEPAMLGLITPRSLAARMEGNR